MYDLGLEAPDEEAKGHHGQVDQEQQQNDKAEAVVHDECELKDSGSSGYHKCLHNCQDPCRSTRTQGASALSESWQASVCVPCRTWKAPGKELATAAHMATTVRTFAEDMS